MFGKEKTLKLKSLLFHGKKNHELSNVNSKYGFFIALCKKLKKKTGFFDFKKKRSSETLVPWIDKCITLVIKLYN